MKVAFYNIGCKVNFAEISTIQEQFKAADHQIVEFGESADAVFIHTCTVTNQADSDCRKTIRKARRDNPNAFIGVMGCYSQLKPEEIAEIEGVDIILGNEEKFKILDLVNDFAKKSQPEIHTDMLKDSEFHFATSIDNEVHTRIALKIQDGCDYYCTYCAVAYSRGRSRSMEFADLEKSVLKLNADGAKEIVLSGINIGEYKSKTGENFTDAVKMISELPIQSRLRISSIEPNLVTDEILDTIANSKVFCPHFHIPLQSGSDTILKKMNRRYDTEIFSNLISRIHDKIENCCIGIDVICGFPGETDELFDETYQLLKNTNFAYLHVFTYSDRDIAKASKFENKIPKTVKKQRTKLLRELSDSKKVEYHNKCIGSIARIIPEKYFADRQEISAWTDNYVRVHFKSDSDLPKEYFNVRIISNEGDYCQAELLS